MTGGTGSDVIFIFVDVGQGDCTIAIDRATNASLVIDCPAGAESRVAAILQRFNAVLHTAAITHFDDDHSAGLLALCELTPPQRIVARIVENESPGTILQYRQIKQLKDRYSAQFDSIGSGHQDVIGRVRWRVVGPSSDLILRAATRHTPPGTKRHRNRTSVVFKIVATSDGPGARDVSMLISGDADAMAWRDMIDQAADVDADFLRWPHHGADLVGQHAQSGTSLRSAVLNVVNPRAVYVGLGSNNSYGHPARAVLSEVRSRPTVTQYCGQVTHKCQVGVAGSTPCAGDLAITIQPSGATFPSRTPVDQVSFVAREWSTPRCI